jgi:hypothetical protein
MTPPTWDQARRGRRFPERCPGAPPFYPRPQWGSGEGWRCGACWHRTAAHWYDRSDHRFKDRPGTRWCQMCGAFCPAASCLSPKAATAKAQLERSGGLRTHDSKGSNRVGTGPNTSPPDSRVKA